MEKPLRFTSTDEVVQDYAPVGASIKFDSQDDELERLIRLRAEAVKSDIEQIKNKNKSIHEELPKIKIKDYTDIPKTTDKTQKQETSFENLPKLKPLDGKDIKRELNLNEQSPKQTEKEMLLDIDLGEFLPKEDVVDLPGDTFVKKAENENQTGINLASNLDMDLPKEKAVNLEQDLADIKNENDDAIKVGFEEFGVNLFQNEVPSLPQNESAQEAQGLDDLKDDIIEAQIKNLEQNLATNLEANLPSEENLPQETKDENLDVKFGQNLVTNSDMDLQKDEDTISLDNEPKIQEEIDLPEVEGMGGLQEINTPKKENENLSLNDDKKDLQPDFKIIFNTGLDQIEQDKQYEKVKSEPVKQKSRAELLADIGIGGEAEASMLSLQDDEIEKRTLVKDRLDDYLKRLIELGGSDLHLKSGKIVRGRFNGEIAKMDEDAMDYDNSMLLAKEILGANFHSLIKKKSVDFTYRLNDDYRFRSNIFLQMDGVSMVFRTIPIKIPTMDELLLPPVIKKLCDKVNRGIILVTGPTGSGKTTTLASMINYLNHTKNYHIVTIEDPIEFIYSDDKSVINQRGIGQDVDNFTDALRASLREDPDVIFVGEMRDLETIRMALNAAETGHLVLATLHTLDAKETIGRVINMFPKEEQNRIRMTFASVAEAIIAQRLVVTVQNKRRVACEIMVKNIRIRDMILENRDSEIYDAIEQSSNTYHMQTFEQHLLELYTSGIITKDEALKSAGRRENLDIKIKSADMAKKRALVESLEEDEELLKEFQSDVIALKDIK